MWCTHVWGKNKAFKPRPQILHVLVVSRCFHIIQMASYNPQLSGTWIIFLACLLQLGNSGTIAPPKRTNQKKKECGRRAVSLFQDLSPLLVASFRLASFRNIKCGKCGLLVISVVFVKSISGIFFSVLHTGCLSSIKNNRDCWTI